MNKDEILEKSRKEKEDEGINHIHSKGRKYGVIGMTAAVCIICIYNLYTRKIFCNYAILSIFFTYLGCESLGMFIETKSKTELIKLIIGIILSLYFFIIYYFSMVN